MRFFDQLPHLWSSGTTHAEYNRPIPNTKQHSFKPKAIRIPALLSLFFLFTICLAWLEILLDRTVKPSEYYKSHGIDNGLKKRQAISPGQCPAPDVNAQNLASLRSKHSELCSSYTTVFKPETTDLPPPMQTSFDQWLAIYSSMEALSELAESCALSQFSSSALSSLLSSLTSPSTATSASVSGAQSSSLLGTTSAATLTSQNQNTALTAADKASSVAGNSNTVDAGSSTFASAAIQSGSTSSVATSASAITGLSSSPDTLSSNASQQSSSLPGSPITQSSSSDSTLATSTNSATSSTSATDPTTNPTLSSSSTTESLTSAFSSSGSSTLAQPQSGTSTLSQTPSGSIMEATSFQSSGVSTGTLSSSSINANGTTSSPTTSVSQRVNTNTVASEAPDSTVTTSSDDSTFSSSAPNITTTLTDTPTDTVTSEVFSNSPTVPTNTTISETMLVTLEESTNTTASGDATMTPEPTLTPATNETVTIPITTTNSTVPTDTISTQETAPNISISDTITTTLELSPNTTTSVSTDSLTTPTPNSNTTTPAKTTTIPETTTNTTVPEVTTPTDSAADNSTVCEEPGQSCNGGCDASICTCQSSSGKKRAGLICSADPCACQQNPANSSHIECGEGINICNDICTGPFTPDGTACNCESETCFCQNSTCTVNTTQTDPGSCIYGETCYSCEAEKCVCQNISPASLFRRFIAVLVGRSDTYCAVDQCFCTYDSELAQYQCGDVDYCNVNSVTSTTSSLDPTPFSQINESISQLPSTTSETTSSVPDSTTPDPTIPSSATSNATTSEFTTPEPTTPDSTTTDLTTSDTTTPETTSLSSSNITPAPCTPGTACGSCTADHCSCSSFPTIGPSCVVDTCSCSLRSETWQCNTINLCAATSTTPTETPVTTTPSFSTITPAPCTPGSFCDSCTADYCSCSSFPTISASCIVDTCSCSLQSSTWQCNTVNLCAPTSTTPSSTTSAEEPDSSRSCQPGNPCQNCGADSCYCRDDGFCDISDGSGTSTCDNCTSSLGRIRRNAPEYGFLLDGRSQTIRHKDVPHGIPHVTNVTDSLRRFADNNRDDHGSSLRLRNIWGIMNKRQGIEILTGDYQTPIRDAWNYLLWTSPLTVRRTSSSVVSTTVAATFTLDVFPGGFTSWPSLTTTPPLATQPKEPACIPATLIQPILSMRAKRDGSVSVIKSVKPYVTRESTTVVVKIRDNYLETTSNVPTVTQAITNTGTISGALQALTSQTITVETIAPDGSTQTLSVVVIRPSDSLNKGAEAAATVQRLGTPQETSVSLSGGDDDGDSNDSDGDSNDNGGAGGGGGSSPGGSGSDEGTKSNPADKKIQKLTDSQRVVDAKYTAASYFGAMYAPALLAIFVKILFEPMLAALKGMEPFERLHREQGATAEDSLCSQYLSSSLSWDTVRSIWTGSSIPLWTTIIYVMVSISAPLASASMTIRPMDECWKPEENTWKFCTPAWVIDIRFLRTLEALLVICIALTLILLWSSWKYHAGVPTNPTSIASVAVLLNYEPLRQDLQAIDPEATSDELEHALEDYHFWLIHHSPSRIESRYGFVHAQSSNTITAAPTLPTFLAKFETRYNRLRPHLHSRHSLKLTDTIHLFTTLTLLALLTTYRANTKNDKFNSFFASYDFWPKFILVALATSLDMQWKSLEREVRITEPYRRLYLGNARPENTILRSLDGTCWSNLPRAWRDLFKYDHMWFEALVGITAILSDINIIAVSGVLMTYSQTYVAYQWSSVTALCTTGFMFAVLILVVFWWRRTDAVSEMPRAPETVGAVLSFLCISRMAVEFAGMGLEDLGKEERDRVIVGLGRRYRFGRMEGEDGKVRCCVDFDEGGEGEGSGDGCGERKSWLQAKMERPVPVRLGS